MQLLAEARRLADYPRWPAADRARRPAEATSLRASALFLACRSSVICRCHVLTDQNDEWTESRRHIGPDILAKVDTTASKEASPHRR